MKILLSLIIITAISDLAFCQKKTDRDYWHLTVIDSSNNKGVASASVLIKRTKHFVTDVNGSILINRALIDPKDTIKISSVGYSMFLLLPSLSQKLPDTVRLVESIIALKEVTINSSVAAQIQLRVIKKHYNSHWHPNPDEEYGVYLPNLLHVSGIISNVNFVVNDAVHGIEMPFQIKLYSREKNGIFPDHTLLKDSVIVYNNKKEKSLTIDISEYNVPIPEDGFFVVFKTLPATFYQKDLVWIRLKAYRDDQAMVKVPGIDYDNDNPEAPVVVFDQSPKQGTSYSIIRLIRPDWAEWRLFRPGINFAIGAAIIQN